MSTATAERVEVSIPALLRLAWPVVIGRSTQLVVGLADALMVAHLGETSLASVTTGALNTIAAFILPVGTVFIVSSFAAQYFGRGEPESARRYPFYGFAVAALAQVLALLALPLLPTLFSRFGFAPDVQAQVQQYLAIRLLSMGVVVATEALSSYYAGIGNTRLPMVVSMVAMVLDVFGNWLLIDGHLGLPAMGVAGAAWSSVASAALPFLGFLAYFLVQGAREKNLLPRLSWGELWRMLRFGVPMGFNILLELLASLFFVNIVVSGLGTQVLAVLMAVMQLNQVAVLPAFAAASAGAVVVGQAIGAGRRDEVPRAIRLTFLLVGAWQGLIGLLFILAPGPLLAGFTPGGENPAAFLALGSRMLMLAAAWQLFDAVGCVLADGLRAAGDTVFPMWIRLGLAWFVFVPGAYISVRWYGGGEMMALFWFMLYLVGLAVALYLRFQSGAWKRFDLVQQEGAVAPAPATGP